MVALGATIVPFAIWRSFSARFDDPEQLAGPFLGLATAALVVAVTHRRTLSWPGVAGLLTMVAGAGAAIRALDADGNTSFNDAFWRAHFVIMAGSLVVAGWCFWSRTISRPAAVAALVLSWAFFGAWGVGLAWIAWTLAVARTGRARSQSA